MKHINKSFWINSTTGKMCKLCSVEEMALDGKLHTEWYFEGYNPLPVKGKFNSSYPILVDWLRTNGWVRQNKILPINQPDIVKVFIHIK